VHVLSRRSIKRELFSGCLIHFRTSDKKGKGNCTLTWRWLMQLRSHYTIDFRESRLSFRWVILMWPINFAGHQLLLKVHGTECKPWYLQYSSASHATSFFSLETRLSSLKTRVSSLERRIASCERVVTYFWAVMYSVKLQNSCITQSQ